MEEKEQERVLGYLESEGFPMGSSEIDVIGKDEDVPHDAQLVNEKRKHDAHTDTWDTDEGEMGTPGTTLAELLKTHKRIERVVEEGVCNNLAMRRQLAANFFDKFGDCFPWPRRHNIQMGLF